jgi:hypothetical protein
MKAAIWLGAGVGGTIGGWIPTLWGAGVFSLWALLLSTVGGIAGIVIVYRLYQS